VAHAEAQGQVLLRGLGQGVFSEPGRFGSGDELLGQGEDRAAAVHCQANLDSMGHDAVAVNGLYL
jgi:hypothetical protein